MAFEKGNSGNPSGRKPGAKNKVNMELRERITAFLNGNFDTVAEDFKNLSAKDKLKFYTDLLQYGVPKLQATSTEVDFDNMTEEQLDYIINQLLEKKHEQE